MDEKGRFTRTVEVGWHVISALILVGTVIGASSVGYGYIIVMNNKLERVISDQKDDRDTLKQFSTEAREALITISNKISDLRVDVTKKH